MYFRKYSTNNATLREWSRQLNVVSKANYPLYDTEEKTINHWKNILNQNIGINTFDVEKNIDSTIDNWRDRLNNIYNK